MKKPIDISNQKFGRLTPLFVTGRNGKNRNAIWLCKCECGKETAVDVQSLKNGNTTSCGCRMRERAIETNMIEYGKSAFNTLYARYISKAKERNILFELTKETFSEITKRSCFYCGKEPSQIVKNRANNGDYVYNGIDRIDSSKGYIMSNVVPCCGRCNEAKMSETQKDFIEWIKQVYTHLGLDKNVV